MITIDIIRATFPELRDVTLICDTSGEKYVFHAKSKDQDIVLKLLKRIENKARTDREIAAVKKLNSDFVPKIFDFGQRLVGKDRSYYIVEEFIVGETYRTILERLPKRPLDEVLNLGLALLEACVDFEKENLVHRDIKPENLMIDTTGKVWVIDFGIVRHLDLSAITPSGNFGPGTYGYAAPEQFRNLKAEINSRADLYSIGIVLYESLNGRNPYLDIHDPIQRIRRMESSDLPHLMILGDPQNRLSEFLSSLTSRFPSRRPQTASEALRWFLEIQSAILLPEQ